jgi:ATP-dependent RNA helicase DHX29
MLDEMPASETVAGTNTVIQIRDMSLPKHWAGRTPKVVLTETVYKTDKYAAVSFFPIGGASRACRAGVNIRWGGGKSQEWCMEDEGCYDDRQAEQFISTVALHALTFTVQPGFANATVTGGAQTYFRVLPPVYRDLWDELEVKRKSGEDEINRRIWGMLRDIVEPRLGSSLKVHDSVCNFVTRV